MTETNQQSKPFPSIAVAIGLLLILILVFVFWPNDEKATPASVSIQVPVAKVDDRAPTIGKSEDIVEPTIITEDFVEVAPLPEVNVEELAAVTSDFIEPEEEEIVPEPLDISDQTVKETIILLSRVPMLTTLVMNDGILERVVASVVNTAQGDLPANTNLLSPPKDEFSVYKQADTLYINPASFDRYRPYAEAFAQMETEDILALYAKYSEQLNAQFDEIAAPGTTFKETLIDAINQLLDTPAVSLPIAVQTDRAMYQFVNPQLEALSPVQKQLLRMGPQNMRLVMRKLRDLRSALQD